jgi:hypothetical protein
MRVCLFILLILSCALNSTAASYSLVQIHFDPRDTEKLNRLLERGLDVIYYNGRENYFELIVSEDQRIDLQKHGYDVKPVIPDFTAYTEGVLNEPYFSHFHSSDRILAELQQMVADHPDKAALYDIGDSYNKIHGTGGHDIWALKISDNVAVDEPDEADALFMANIHAREIITPEIVMYFAHYLLDEYDRNPYIGHLVDNREIWLVPLINPDGHERVFSGDINAVLTSIDYADPVYWRKNMSDNNNNGFFDAVADGVDLNRNFGYQFGFDNIGSSPSIYSDVYRGPYAFSEPESQVIRDFVEQHSFVTSLSFHSFGQYWLYPWGYERLNPPQPDLASFQALGDSCVHYNGYEAGNYYTGTIYQTNGDTDDWLYGIHDVFAFTPEVGSTSQGRFWPDTTVISTLILENLGPCIYMAYAAGEEPLVSCQRLPDFETAQDSYPLKAMIRPPVLLTDPVPLNPFGFQVFYNTSKNLPFKKSLLAATEIENEYSGVIPGGESGVKVYYYVQAGDTKGRLGTWPRGAPAAVDSFAIGLDNTPPVIHHEVMDFQPPSVTDLKITASVTDNVRIADVWLEVQKNHQEEIQLPMNPSAVDDEYSVSLADLNLTSGDSVFYRIVAVDASTRHNKTVLPENARYFFGIYLSLALYDFENDFVCRTDAQSDWQWGSPVYGPDTAHSGNNVWGTILDGPYHSSSNSGLDVPEILLDTTFKKVAFRFWQWYQTEYSQGSIWDGGNVKLSMDGGPYQVIMPDQGYDGIIDAFNPVLGKEPGFGGPPEAAPDWRLVSFNLDEYIGHSVQIRFHFGSDDNTDLAGWYVDDMEWLAFPSVKTGTGQYKRELPEVFQILQNYPNPFNNQTRFEFHIPHRTRVRLALYNTLGQVVKVIQDRICEAGRYMVVWDGTDQNGLGVGSGVYLCQLQCDAFQKVIKMDFIR